MSGIIENNSMTDIEADIEAVKNIPIVESLLEVICKTTGMGFAAIARVTETKWVTCVVRDEISLGIKPGGELVMETTIRNQIFQHHNPVVIDNVAEDDIFKGLTIPAKFSFQSYISIPIFRKNGLFFGTLCAIDPKPAKINNKETIGMFKLFAELIAFHLHTYDELLISEIKLAEERESVALREKFIAILGHDLRNPLGAVTMSAALLMDDPDKDEVKELANIIKNSSARMNGLIGKMLDFARAKLGSGIPIDVKDCDDISIILNQIITELKTNHPAFLIETTYSLKKTLICDANRLGQLFSNLVMNAIAHGDITKPVEVKAMSDDDNFILSVSNYGNTIPADIIENLFQPFYRGSEQKDKNGLGLGLYISSEIAQAHGGNIDIISADGKTTFTLNIPMQQK